MRLKKYICLMLALIIVLLMPACGRKEDVQNNNTSENETIPAEQVTQVKGEEITLNLWYTNSYMQDFLENAVTRFMDDNPGITVNLKLSAETGYLENINSNSIKKTNVVDVYMLPEEDLEQAYLAGLALSYEPEGTVFNTDNYCETALRAVTYNGKRVAYPLCFDSAFLVYNRAYTSDAPKTFDELLDFANNYVVEDESSVGAQLEKVLIWNVSDVEMNYHFLSDSFVVGGENGDNRDEVNIYNANVIKGLEYYKSLNDFFALDRTTISDEEVVDYFVSGKAAFTITNTAGLTVLHTAGMDFGVCGIPNITDTLTTSALSTTQTLVINPYSDYAEQAKALVNALAYEYADDFYVKTGYFPSRYSWDYESEMVDGVYANYADSVSRPKLMNMGDFYIKLEIMLHNVWDDGDTESLLMEFQNFVKEQLER